MPRWSLPDCANLALVVLLIFSVWLLVFCWELDEGHGRGGDFLQFYTAGTVLNLGEAGRLYDQAYFRELQGTLGEFLGENPFYSLYPPTLAVLMSPLARLPYPTALGLWWAIQAGCFAAAGWALYRWMSHVSPAWRWTALLALATLYPLWLTVRLGHLSALLLVVMLAGLGLHSRGRQVAAGCVLSLLALKPQFAAAIFLWLVLRRDLRTIGGMALGGLVQLLAVLALVGPEPLVQYAIALPGMNAIVRAYAYCPMIEQSVSGIISNVMLWSFGYDDRNLPVPLALVQLLPAGLAGYWLFRLNCSRHRAPCSHGRCAGLGPEHGVCRLQRYEYAGVVLFMLLAPPYLLGYDLLLLAVPIALLWSTPNWRMGMALYASVTLPAAIAYTCLSFSIVPLVVLWVMVHMERAARASEEPGETTAQRSGFLKGILPCESP